MIFDPAIPSPDEHLAASGHFLGDKAREGQGCAHRLSLVPGPDETGQRVGIGHIPLDETHRNPDRHAAPPGCAFRDIKFGSSLFGVGSNGVMRVA